jgi:hypothetical protein
LIVATHARSEDNERMRVKPKLRRDIYGWTLKIEPSIIDRSSFNQTLLKRFELIEVNGLISITKRFFGLVVHFND